MKAMPANPFWDFSLEVYQRRNVADRKSVV